VSPSDRTSERNLIAEGALDAVKIGAGETYLGAFGVLLGGTNLQIGALATVPSLIGSISQVVGMKLAERVESRRALVTALIRLQGLVWLPIGLLAFVLNPGWWAVSALLFFVSLHHILSGILAPLWNSLVGDVVAPTVRGSFFGHRNRWIAVFSFASLVAAGSLIHAFSSVNAEVIAFAAVFLVAGFARALSGRFFSRVEDPRLIVPEHSKFTFWQFIRRVRASNFVRFVLFVSLINFGAAISGPYFAIYMLKDLKLSYLQYTGAICFAVLAQFLVMRTWGALSDKFGNRKILSVCSWFVACTPLFWLFSSHYLFILLIQFYSGFFWSGFNIAAANFVFDAVTPEKRARCIAYQGIINGTLVSIGGVVGGLLATHVLPHMPLLGGSDAHSSPFLGLFLLSGLLRLTVVGFLLNSFKEVRQVAGISGHQLLIRIVSVRPFWGATYSFVSGTYSVMTGRPRRRANAQRKREVVEE
jgi:MFS family permease